MEEKIKTSQKVGSLATTGVVLAHTAIIKTPKEYIEKYLIKEIGEIVHAHQELSWVLMMAGIELLGRCVKAKIADDSNNELYFREGLKLFKSDYQKYNTDSNNPYDFYKKLRCGFSHLTFPKDSVAISERVNGSTNLSFFNGKLIVVAEDFYEDFKEACGKVIGMFGAGTIKPDFHYYGVEYYAFPGSTNDGNNL